MLLHTNLALYRIHRESD